MTVARVATRAQLAPRRGRRPRGLRYVDWALVIGLGAVGALLFIALYGPILAPRDPWDVRTLYQGKVPPFDPGPDYVLGSDPVGRDRLSWLLYGARMTFTIALGATAIRLLIGATLGVAAGWRGGKWDSLLSRVAVGLSSIPATIAAVLGVIAFNVNGGAWSFILGLSVVGWADAYQHTRRATRAEAAKPHIDSARSLGLTERRLVLRHLMPNLAPSLLTISSLQVSAVLLLMGELALLRIFFGGAISTGLSGSYALAPSQPEWASTLAATRPIFDLYGNAISVLAPGVALLFSVISFNLFGDALARRAQRLDIFHLFSARQWLLLAVGAIAVVTPALLWPGPLAADTAYANRFSATRALTMTADLAAMDRTAESAGAASAALTLRNALGGQILAIDATVSRVQSLTAVSGSRTLSLGPDLAALSPNSSSVRGEAVLVEPSIALQTGRPSELLADRVVFLRNARPASMSGLFASLSRAHVAGVVIISDDDSLGSEPPYAVVPTIRMTSAGARDLLGRELPAWPGAQTIAVPLNASVGFDLQVTPTPVAASNVVLRIPARAAGAWPLFVVVAPYDYPGSASDLRRAETASASGVLVAVADAVRASPLDADIVIVATAVQSLDDVGLRAALQTLSSDEQQRLAAVVSIQSALTHQTVLEPDQATQSSGGGQNVAGRVAGAVGQQIAPQASTALMRALTAAGVRAPTIELVGSDGASAQADAQSVSASGRSVLAFLSYATQHLDKLRP